MKLLNLLSRSTGFAIAVKMKEPWCYSPSMH